MDIKIKLRNALMEQEERKVSAGVLIQCTKTGRVLLLQRNEDGGKHHGVWSVMSGTIEDGETILEGLKREVNEELSINPSIIEYKHIQKENNSGDIFHYYEGFTNSEFIPKLDHENLDYGWFSEEDIPTPLYPNMDTKLEKIWKKSQT